MRDNTYTETNTVTGTTYIHRDSHIHRHKYFHRDKYTHRDKHNTEKRLHTQRQVTQYLGGYSTHEKREKVLPFSSLLPPCSFHPSSLIPPCPPSSLLPSLSNLLTTPLPPPLPLPSSLPCIFILPPPFQQHEADQPPWG